MRKLLGYSLLVISSIAWVIIPVIPFLSLSVAQKASWATAVFVFAEATWWLAMPLLGKEIIDYSKAAWQQCKAFLSRKGDPTESQQADNLDE